MRFDLNSPSLAQYHWGTLFCRFSPVAPVAKKTFIQTVAGITYKQAPWSTDEEFRAAAALIHEMVHLAQDLTTGLGHWDYIWHRTEVAVLLRYASIVVDLNGVGGRPPYALPDAEGPDGFVSEALDQLRYYPFAAVPKVRLGRIREWMEQELARAVDDETLFDFSTQSVLESDAALNVVLQIRKLNVSEEQLNVLKRNLAAVSPNTLGAEYVKAKQHLEAVVAHHCDLDERQLGLVLPKVFGLFVDSALAFPPNEWIAAHDQSADAYDPGLKYMRLLLAFQQLAGAEMERFWLALMDDRLAEAEALVLAKAAFRYPLAKEVYEAWVEALEPMRNKSIVAEVRQGSCRYRLKHGGLSVERGIQLLFDMQVPILYLHKDHGFVKHDWNLRVVDQDASNRLTRELVDHFMIMELVEFLFRTGEFRCPHAQANTCPIAEDGCSAGYLHPTQLPESPECIARAVLSSCGVKIYN